MSLLDLFKPSQPAEPEAPKANMTGSPVHVNLSPSDRQAILRHLIRIQRCRYAFAETEDQARSESLANELNRRLYSLKSAGINVPSNPSELKALIREYGG